MTKQYDGELEYLGDDGLSIHKFAERVNLVNATTPESVPFLPVVGPESAGTVETPYRFQPEPGATVVEADPSPQKETPPKTS